jgi:hypothetical protein
VTSHRWRDAEPDQFAATVLTAAEQLGVQPLAVEKAFLADRLLASDVLGSCFAVSRNFTPDRPVPRGGFARTAAFDPDGPLAAGCVPSTIQPCVISITGPTLHRHSMT